MKKYIFALIVVFLLAACSAPAVGDVAPMGESSAAPMRTPKPTATGTPQAADAPTIDPYLHLHGSETAIALNQAALDQEASRLQQQQAAMGMQMTVDAATSQAWYTVTAIVKADALATSAAGTQAAGSATAYVPTQAALTQQADKEKKALQAEIVRMWIGIVFLAIFAVIILAMVGYGAWKAIKLTEFKQSQMRPDEKGRLPAVPEDTIPGRSKRIVVPDRGHRAVVGKDTDDLTAEQALENANAARALEMTRATAEAYAVARRVPPTRENGAASASGLPIISKPNQPLLTTLPDWSQWTRQWTPNGSLPLGVSETGLLELNPDSSDSHPLVAGKSGSGKTRFMLRPLSAFALASGWQVILCGDLVGYHLFEGHPNAHLFPYKNESNEERVAKVIRYLRNANAEKDRRKKALFEQSSTLWSPEIGPRVLIMADEFSNMCEDIPPAMKDDLYEQGRLLVREGRKVGMHLAIAVHDVTKDYFDIAIRRQMTPIAFRLGDDDFSRKMVNSNGAVSLPDRHFMTIHMGLKTSVAFAPSDDDITALLDAHPAQRVAPPDWIDATVTDVTPTATPATNPDAERDLKIWSMYMDGKSMNEIQRAIFDGKTGGAFYGIVRDVIERYKQVENASTTSTTTRILPSTGPLAA